MIDYYLNFADEAAANAALYTTVIAPEILADNGSIITPELTQLIPIYQNIDTIGVIFKPTGAVDGEGISVLTAVAGWHVNVRSEKEIFDLAEFQVNPINPVRIWA